MIFQAIDKVKLDLTAESEFKELIQIYCRLVSVFCEKHKLAKPSGIKVDSAILKEMCSIGVIDKSDQINDLEACLGETAFNEFVNSVSFVVGHRDLLNGLLDNLNNKQRRIKQEQINKKAPTVVDFFCGAGGLSLGFIQNGFRIVLANDIEDVCVETYKYNHPELSTDRVIKGDIKDIIQNIDRYIDEDVDVVIGGPPCQGFSEANRQRVINDPRNQLYKYYVEAISKIGPKVVVMENVKGMLKVASQVVEDYEKLRVNKDGKIFQYKVAYKVLNSEKFGVAQSRERLIYIAIRDDVIQEKNITPEQIFNKITKKFNLKNPYTLANALDDIKPLEAQRTKNKNEEDSDTSGKKIDVNKYEKNSNAYLDLINMGRDIPFVFNHKARYCNDVNFEIYRRLNQGDDATDEKIKDIMPYAHRNHCFKDKYYKLIADKPCRTITAHLRMDCHSHIHPFQIRSLTPREAARVQSFPDDYLFLGAYLKTYMQIGNAVPPVMARGIASIIKELL